jgi:exopolysaccharide biosynthesis WecB/TagA/CpsF family protein
MNIVANMAVLSSHRQVFGLPVCDLNWPEAFSFVAALADMPAGQTQITFLNAHNANIMLRDRKYRQVLERSLVLPDGIGVDIASFSVSGSPFPANLNGTDFVPALLTYITKPMRVGLLGARPATLAKARQNLAAHAPWHEFIAIHDGFFSDDDSAGIAAEVGRNNIDILLVALGTPKQEKWAAEHIRPEHARLVMSVGALFDFVAGEVPRAPQIARRMRLEWAYRVLQEPRRLAGRYFVGGPVFLGHVAAYAIKFWAANLFGARRGVEKPADRATISHGSDGI